MSLEVPRFTFILVVSADPTPFGDIHLWSLLHGMITFPSAISCMSLSSEICSFDATVFISLVNMPFLADSICVM